LLPYLTWRSLVVEFLEPEFQMVEQCDLATTIFFKQYQDILATKQIVVFNKQKWL
jgi:hypothetical protein